MVPVGNSLVMPRCEAVTPVYDCSTHAVPAPGNGKGVMCFEYWQVNMCAQANRSVIPPVPRVPSKVQLKHPWASHIDCNQ